MLSFVQKYISVDWNYILKQLLINFDAENKVSILFIIKRDNLRFYQHINGNSLDIFLFYQC